MKSPSNISPSERFRQLLSNADKDFDLTEAALLIAAEEYPELDVGHYLSRVDELAETLKRRLRQDISQADTIRALNTFLFTENGFAPDTTDYYDPRNSFLNDVLDRRVGIPITLSILYMEIGRRVGLNIEGVSFPGHFLVRCPLRGGVVILDPYGKGISLGISDLQARLQQMYGGDAPSETKVASMLIAASKKEILARVLRNLKNIYLFHNQLPQALSAVERIVTIAPDAAEEIRDRGLIYLGLECYRPAMMDLQTYLELAPEANDIEDIRERVIELQTLNPTIN